MIAHVLHAFQAAPLVANGWDLALRAMASATGSSRGNLIGIGRRHLRFNWMTDVEPEYFDDFVAIGGERYDVNWRIAASAAPFELVHEKHYDAVRARGTYDAYDEHVHRFDAEHGCQMVLLDNPAAFFGIACLHSAADGRTTAADRRAFTAIAPHVLTAIKLQNALEHQGADLLRGSLEAMRVAAVLLDSCGWVCGLTPAAETILSFGAIDIRNHRLRARSSAHDRDLQGMIASALRKEQRVIRPDLWIDRDGRAQVMVEAFPLPHAETGFGFAPAVVVTLRTPATLADRDAAAISTALGLTEAEGEVMAMLSAGVSRASIAAARGTSVQTVASQLKTIFRKCDVRREAELVALVGSIVGSR